MKIAVDELRKNVIETITVANITGPGTRASPHNDAQRIAEVLLWADMSGISTQGIIKLTGTEPLQHIVPKHEVKIEREMPLSVLIDGGANPAPLVSQLATDRVIEKATAGFGLVGIRNLFSSTGAQAFYATRIAQAGLIGIVQSSPAGSTAGFGSIDPLFGTNPMAFSFPTTTEPLVFDMATSAMTWYGLILAQAQGVPIPPDVAIDGDGNATTDPSSAMKGALLPTDRGYKGAGLAMVVEVLAGVLTGAGYCDVVADGEWGSLLIAIDPELLMDRHEFKTRCSDLIAKIKSSRKEPGLDEIRLPGERSRSCYEESVRTGYVDVDENILRELNFC